MRSWHPIEPQRLDDDRLKGEHAELHLIAAQVVNNRDGWRNHPERKRWEDHLPALAARHDCIVKEMRRRGWGHRSPMAFEGPVVWPETIQPLEDMKALLIEKQGGLW